MSATRRCGTMGLVVLFDLDMRDIASRVPANPLTRFAPAPTGWLHLGHVLNAEYVWGLARAAGGRVLLRIEDHDAGRSRPQFEAGILDDLDWLGFRPDVFTTSEFRAGRCDGRQSDRGDVYEAALDALARKGLVYGCECSRRAMASSADATGMELHYAGGCRDRHLPLERGLGWRLRIEPGVEMFDDLRLGVQRQEPALQCGDLLVRERSGNWTYQFAAAVDDWRQGIDLVVRGEDLLRSTGRQVRVAGLLGREHMPAFLHHRLLMRSPTQKLSKSEGDTGVRELRAQGWAPEQVRQAAMATLPVGP